MSDDDPYTAPRPRKYYCTKVDYRLGCWFAEVYVDDADRPIWSRPRLTHRGARWAAFWAARRLRRYHRQGLL